MLSGWNCTPWTLYFLCWIPIIIPSSVSAVIRRFLGNVFLTQEQDNILFEKKLKIVTKKKPSPNQLNTLMFAFNISKFVKSNAIVLTKNNSTIEIKSNIKFSKKDLGSSISCSGVCLTLVSYKSKICKLAKISFGRSI